MSTIALHWIFTLAICAYAIGAASCLASWRNARTARYLCCSFGIAGSLLQAYGAVAGLFTENADRWSVSSGVPLFGYSFNYDALACFFSLALAVVAAATSIYSISYLKDFEGKRNIAFFGFLYHLLLLSLTLVFTVSNAFFFLIAWEVMALAAYGLVTFYHEQPETRRAGFLYIIMAHIDVGCLLLGFALLTQASGSAEFSSFSTVNLSGALQAAAFLLFFFGFGIKAGIIPFHIWLPAAHPVAPSNISALLSSIVLKTGIYGMSRVFFGFFDMLPVWSGVLVLTLGVISAVLGVLYALMEHDLKRLLAYHSIENIGIILMGIGPALIFRATQHPQLAALALIAGLFHTVNHAVFKCLLFLGAGSVLHSTGTPNMEEHGGLIRPMPWTALCFLIGAVAISGLPPLNGFVSEWLTYQSLLAGFGATKGLTRVLFPIAGSMLALTGALAAACFVKAFGITFLALPRGKEARHAHEAPRSMLIGMSSLAIVCLALGLGMTWFLSAFDNVTQQLFSIRVGTSLTTSNRLVLSVGEAHASSVSTVIVGLGLLAIIGAIAFVVRTRQKRLGRMRGPTWDCGLPGLSDENEYTATAFSKALRMIFSVLYQPRREIQAVFDVSPYYPKEIHFKSEIEPTFEKRVYAPIKDLIFWLSTKMWAVQAGSVHAYLTYIFITLVVLLLMLSRQ